MYSPSWTPDKRKYLPWALIYILALLASAEIAIWVSFYHTCYEESFVLNQSKSTLNRILTTTIVTYIDQNAYNDVKMAFDQIKFLGYIQLRPRETFSCHYTYTALYYGWKFRFETKYVNAQVEQLYLISSVIRCISKNCNCWLFLHSQNERQGLELHHVKERFS